MKKKFVYIGNGIIVISVLMYVMVSLIQQKNIIWRTWENIILDNESHYLSCDQLPSVEKVHETVLAHKEEIERMIQEVSKHYRPDNSVPVWEIFDETKQGSVRDGQLSYIDFGWGESINCRGLRKGDIRIYYPGHADRKFIKQLFGDTFFGIPYTLTNV